MRYRIESFGGLKAVTYTSWIDATLVAEKFAVESLMPATITDDDGRRWNKYPGQPPVLAEGPSK